MPVCLLLTTGWRCQQRCAKGKCLRKHGVNVYIYLYIMYNIYSIATMTIISSVNMIELLWFEMERRRKKNQTLQWLTDCGGYGSSHDPFYPIGPTERQYYIIYVRREISLWRMHARTHLHPRRHHRRTYGRRRSRRQSPAASRIPFYLLYTNMVPIFHLHRALLYNIYK